MFDTEPTHARRDLTASVVIPTYNRPDRLRECLHHLALQTVSPEMIVVVDGSDDDRTLRLVRAEFPQVVHVRNTAGRGKTPESRNIGLNYVTSDVVAFLDDDANARQDWLDQLLRRYRDDDVAGVGGSALNGIAGERSAGIGAVGLLLPDGRLTGNFAADPGRDVDVDHLLGANMSFRREALLLIGGIHGDYPGTCLREETDIALRVGRLGKRLIYTPNAVVDHIPGAYARGERFDRRYTYFANRNTIVMLARNFGFRSPVLRAFLVTAIKEVRNETARALKPKARSGATGVTGVMRNFAGGLSRAAVVALGVVAGFPAALQATRRDARPSARGSAVVTLSTAAGEQV